MLQWIHKNRDEKGFTLIELLVVIAIIGILASIVLVNLNSTRKKAKDTAIKMALVEMRSQAEIDFDADGDYRDTCAEAGGAAGNSTIAYTNIATSITSNGGSGICNESTNSADWAAWSALVSTTTNYWCVDSAGASKLETSAIAADSTVCP